MGKKGKAPLRTKNGAIMASGLPATVAVQYRFIEGCHVFTSHEIYGLYVASKDPQKAYERVGPAIEQLLSVNEGISCQVEAAVPLRDFLRSSRRGRPSEAWQAKQLGARHFVLRPAA
jgi:hypothetical protein